MSKISSCIVGSKLINIWYVSDDGADDSHCHSASAPCRNLQTVLNRAIDGADIYVTSDSLSLDGHRNEYRCEISSPLSYTISSLDNKMFTFTCQSGLCYRYILGVRLNMLNLSVSKMFIGEQEEFYNILII